jgi:hypothetical protein
MVLNFEFIKKTIIDLVRSPIIFALKLVVFFLVLPLLESAIAPAWIDLARYLGIL